MTLPIRSAETVANQMREYINNNYQILGLIGIQESPSCDTLGKKGIFMEELMGLFKRDNIDISFFDVPEGYIEGESEVTIDAFRKHIKSILDK
ncbi:hypothetical protein F8153_12570 [Alkaliphilus serpentinus]|uniref:Uncharacterized protein n=1 Tax=Alkaliphilus serpentinus TaxID=1482731 RepID=A0A833HMB1_9FIRM|nr:hypothetical protein F8153_12570 [Alkaliphilus serpentinus]